MQRTHEEFRNALIFGAIEAVSKNGVETLTTRQICKEADVNEAYIYRYFFDKEDLLKKAFIYADNELATKAAEEIRSLDFTDENFNEKIAAVLKAIWNCLMGDKSKTLFFYSLYYSRMLPGMINDHYNIWNVVTEAFTEKFSGCKINHRLADAVLENIMNYAVKIHLGMIQNEDANTCVACEFLVPAAAKAFGADEKVK